MKVYGLTGGVGMGKSACAHLLQGRGIHIIDTDELAREVVAPGEPALAEIERLFGPGLVDHDGRLLRSELARRVFSDPLARKQLEALLHPKIRDLWLAQVGALREQGCPLAVVVIPLLFETGAEKELDGTICVACSKATQQVRLQPRGWSPEQVEQRIRAQSPVEHKMAQADFVIWTEGSMEVHEEQLRKVLSRIGGNPGPAA